MKKYAIAIVFFLWLGVLVLGQRGRYDFSTPGAFDSIRIGNFTFMQDSVDNDGLELDGALHTAVVAGKSGNVCIHEGNEPTASNSATGSRLWIDTNGVLRHQKSSNAGGGSRTVIVDDGAGNVGIGTDEPKRQFDFDGANVRTQRYFDSDLNTNLGYETFGAGNLSGTHNNAFGRHSLYSITSGSGNSGLGNEILYGVTTGSNNVGVGSMSGKGVVGGSHNISLGYKSGYVVANGDNNISIGSYSNYVGTGSKNITIGYNIDLPIDAGNNQLNIGNLIYGTGLDGVDKAVSTGNVGIGESEPDEKLHMTANNAALKLEDDSGNWAKIKVGDSQLTLEADPDNEVASTDIVFKMDGDEVARFYQGGNFGIDVVYPDAKLEVNGYTMLGSDAPKIKMKKFSGTTDGDAITLVPHGLTTSKILSVHCMIWFNSNMGFPPASSSAFTGTTHYAAYINTGDIRFGQVGTDLQNKPYTCVIMYEE